MLSRRMLVTVTMSGVACALRGLGAESAVIQGVLKQSEGNPPALDTGERQIPLDGDADTKGVLNDKRLGGARLELKGKLLPSATFLVDPIHTRGLYVHKDGKRLFVTYWCDVCSIRTYTPGKCWCCQDDTALDLRESIPGSDK
ncbi:MAG: hypothetical protein ACKV22_31305 [Bryobacteraceae bacterium]